MRKFIIALISLIILFIIYNYYQISNIYINRININSEKLDEDLKIMQISDFHSNQLVNLNKIYENVDKFNPDLILLTGDIIDEDTKDLDYTLGFLKKLSNMNENIYFVSGNHEIGNRRYEEFLYELELMNINIMDDRTTEISINGEELVLGGFSFYSTEDIYKSLAENFKYEKYNILLSHRPDRVLNYLNGSEDLILSGHTHGGQVRLPFIGAVLAPGQGFFPEYDKGIFEKGNTILYIDSGSGNSFLPIRLFNRIQISNIVIE